MSFPFVKQPDKMDCGPACLKMIAKYFGKNFSMQTLRNLSEINREGVSLLGLSEASEKIGLRSLGVTMGFSDIKNVQLPCILHWRHKHFVVLYKIKRNKYFIADPAVGLIALDENAFHESWIGVKIQKEPATDLTGIALLLSPQPDFYKQEAEKEGITGWSYLANYITPYKKLILQLILGLCVGSLLQLITPLLTQSIVDVGIAGRNTNFITLVLFAQAALIIGRLSVEFIRSWILLHISTRINIFILTDFLIKLMKLPIGFFDTKMTGDIMQRMNDQKRIETFLSGAVLNSLFSFFTLAVFLAVLFYYNTTVFILYSLTTVIYICWIFVFLKRRATLDYRSFGVASKAQSSVVQLVAGMQDIKLNNCERQKRWEWEGLQARLFTFKVDTLALSQFQQGGATLINEGSNLFAVFLSANAVMRGELTLGGMVAMQYIIGQLNTPVQQLLGFIQSYQDAKISLQRLNEIHEMENEDSPEKSILPAIPEDKGLKFENVSFRFPGVDNNPVLEDISIDIPKGKTTAIVGTSGSGKTTVLKLLLGFYQPNKGVLSIGNRSLKNVNYKAWRQQCGVVMQDGFIFSDTILNNIAVADTHPDITKVEKALRISNLSDFVDSLPLGLYTKIGAEGNGISQGQKQRILIARAVYKDPKFIFLDEATNALDSNNERLILQNLIEFFKGRTVVIIAHRLSTITKADKIIVLEKGKAVEQGTHKELLELKGGYYNLVRNQLELEL